MNKIRLSIIFTISLFIINCGGSKETENVQWEIDTSQMSPNDNIGDWMVIHELSDADKIHPQVSSGADAQYIEAKIFESLLKTDNHTLEQIPQLAEEMPIVSEDHLTYTFKIRKDVTFSDGKPLTGHDVIFTLKALRNPFTDAASLRNYYKNLAKVELVDDDPYIVKFTCSDVYFKHLLFIGGLNIFPKHHYDPSGLMDQYTFEELEKLLQETTENENVDFSNLPAFQFAEYYNSKELGRNPLGSGPYVFIDWKTDDRLILERNPDYWGFKAGLVGEGYTKRHIHKTVKDHDAAIIGLKAGDIDLIRSLPQELFQHQTKSKKFTKNYNKELFYIPSYSYLGWNNNHPLFKSKMVRRALTHLCDREQIIEVLYYGEAQIAKSSVYFKRPEFNNSIEPWEYNPDLARKILKDEGWEDMDGDGILDKIIDGNKVSFEFTFLTNNGNKIRRDIGLIMAENLRKVGIKADVQQMEWAVYLNNVRDQKFDAIILGWVMPITDSDPYQIFHSSQAVGRGSNSISFKNDLADELIELNRKEFDSEKRKEYMLEFQEILHEEQPYTFLYIPKSNFVYHKRFKGVEVYPFRPGFEPKEWWVPTQMQKYTKN